MLRNSKHSFGLVSILFHWSIALIFLSQILLGYLMTRVTDFTLQFNLFQWHKSFGFLVLWLSALRVLWMAINTRPSTAESLSTIERVGSKVTHAILYAALFLIPLTGWAVASSSPLLIPTYMFNLVVIPPLPLQVSDIAEGFWTATHSYLAYASAIVATLHIMAALHHHFWRKDEVLIRMLRPGFDPVESDRTGEI